MIADHANVAGIQTEFLGKLRARRRDRLRRVMSDQLRAVAFLPFAVCPMRLHAHVADRRDAVVAGMHDVRSFQSRIRIAIRAIDDALFRELLLASGFEIGLVDKVLLHFIRDLDGSHTVFGNVGRIGRDRRNKLAVVQTVIAFVLEEVNGVNPLHFLRTVDIQASDLRLAVFGREQFCIQRTVSLNVAGVFRCTGCLVDTINPRCVLADQRVASPVNNSS